MPRKSFLATATKSKKHFTIDGQEEWIEVKSSLPVRDHKAIKSAALSRAIPSQDPTNETGVEFQLNMPELDTVRMLKWITDWSLVWEHPDKGTQNLPFNRQSLENLDEDAYDVILENLDKHVEAVYHPKVRTKKALPPEVSRVIDITPTTTTPVKKPEEILSGASSSKSESTTSSESGSDGPVRSLAERR